MSRGWRAGFGKFVVALALSGITIPGRESMVLAQIIPDETLGAESSVVNPDTIKGIESGLAEGEALRVRISGGAIRGSNLFHSFREFNIGEGRGGYFENPAAIQNIFSRVTGSNPSNILGTLGVLGNANLFFLNPNGILFGPNASLDLRGSFLATTADNILFPDGKQFSATNPEAPPILTVNVQQPIGLEFEGQRTKARIENRSTAPAGVDLLGEPLSGLRVPDGQSLVLVGGDIAIDRGGLHAPGGRVELAGVAGKETLGLSFDGNKLNLSVPEDLARADISLTNEAFVNTSGDGGGEIGVWGRQVKLSEGSQIAATTLGTKAGRGLAVNASESVELSGTTADKLLSSGLFTQTGGTGDAGDLTITAKHLLVEKGARVLTGTFSQGNAGNLTVNASESVQMIGGTGFTPFGLSYSSRIGSDTGNWFGSRLFISSLVEDQTSVLGRGGNVAIITSQLQLLDGAQIGVSTRGNRDGGSLTVNASKSVRSIGFDPVDSTPSGLFTQTSGKGNAGNITIETGSMSIINSQSGSFSSGKGDAGNLTVRVRESVEVSGKIVFYNIESPSLLSAQVETTGEGRGGNLTIETERLSVNNGGKVQVATFGQGDAGNILIYASEVDVFETPLDSLFTTGILAGIEIDPDQTIIPPRGKGGDLTIETDRLSVRNGAEVSVSTAGLGNAGKLQIQASESVEVVGTSPNGNFKSQISAEVKPDAIGSGGSLSLETGQMIVRDGAEVTVSSLGSGVAGNLEVQADSISLDNQGAITATTRSGNGGDMTLKVQDLLLLRRGSQISTTAGTAQAGGDGGNIIIDTPFIIAFPQENSDISANAFEGKGGNININTNSIFGIEKRDDPTPLSDITASSEFGQQGVVEINTSAIDPTRSLDNLPQEAVEAEVARGCQTVGGQSTLEFFDIGRGGLPPSPDDLFSSETIIVEWIPLDLAEEQTSDKVVSEQEFTTTTPLNLTCHNR